VTVLDATSLVLALALFAYLVVALLYPEKFE
jgi:K+-transporting ATPase KdpF subunit